MRVISGKYKGKILLGFDINVLDQQWIELKNLYLVLFKIILNSS